MRPELYRRRGSIWGKHVNAPKTSAEAVSTYSGATPNSRAVIRSDMTPRKNVTFSRVRTTLAECHVWVIDSKRRETYESQVVDIRNSVGPRGAHVRTLSLYRCSSRSSWTLDVGIIFRTESLRTSFFISFRRSSARILRRSLVFASWRWRRSRWESKYVSMVSLRRVKTRVEYSKGLCTHLGE